jgi:transcription antitermination factor NusG
MEEAEMTRWYVIHTQAQAEARGLWHVTNEGIHCFLPRVLQLRSHARPIRSVLVPVFPRQLFARLNLDETRWRAINGTRGVVSLLANGPHPLPRPAQPSRDVSHRMRFAQRDFTRSDGRVDQGNAGLHQERRGQMGEVTKIFAEGRDRVLTLLGAETELQLPSYAIEAA